MEKLGFYAKSSWLKKYLMIISGILVVLCLFLAVILVVWVINSLNEKSFHRTSAESYPHRIVRVNPLKNETTLGISRLNEEMKTDEFLSYRHEENYFLISGFDTSTYLCTGSCSCEGRRAASIVSNGIYYLLAAVSAALAANLAKNHFEEECKSILEDSCPSGMIQAEVDDCEEKVEKEGETAKNIDSSLSDSEKLFLCEGRCIPNTRDKFDEGRQGTIKKYGHKCYEHRIETMISSTQFHTPCSRNDFIVNYEECAIIEFIMSHLTDAFCEQANNVVLEDVQLDFVLCMAPQLFQPDTSELTNQVVESQSKCHELMSLGSLNCEKEK